MSQTIDAITVSEYLDTAYSIGIHLARTALWYEDRCNWTGSSVEAVNGSFQLVEKSFSTDLYSGTAGIALFLSLLSAHQPDPVLEETLEGTLNQVLYTDDSSLGNWGYYGGKLGVASMLITVGERMSREDLQTKGWDKLLRLCKTPVQDYETDLITGAAGAIPVLIGLYNKSKRSELADAIVQCGNFLVGKANKTATHWSWNSFGSGTPLTGYSHGAAGAALALLELYKLTGDSAYFSGAMMGFNYERMHFNQQIQNWPDFRDQRPAGQLQGPVNTPLSYGESWCHGAPGIALSRAKAWQLTNDPSFKQEAEVALATTHRSIYNLITNPAVPSNFSICHGLAGNADILMEAGRIFQNELYVQVAKEVGTYGIERYLKNRLCWPSGVNDPSGATPGMGETPGLMLGLAGTGYFYLRLAFPQEIRSILLL